MALAFLGSQHAGRTEMVRSMRTASHRGRMHSIPLGTTSFPARGILTGAVALAAVAGQRKALSYSWRNLRRASTATRAVNSEYDFDLFTIGGGSGGVRGSRWAASQFGVKVGLAELPFAIVSTKLTAGGLGGTCVIRGCVPKKLLIYGSHLPEDIKDASGYGWTLPEGTKPELNWDKLIEAKDAEVTRLNSIYKRLLDGAGVQHFEGYARVVDPHTVEVNGKRYTAKYICVATGGRATKLQIPGCDLDGVLTSDEALALPKKPEKLVVIGGGYIAVEFAGYFHGYGSEVHLVFRGDKPLRGFDEDIREHLLELLKVRGIHVHTGENPLSIEEAGEGKLKFKTDKGTELVVDNVMFATGRKPSSQDLGLEEAGVEVDSKSGKILVDEYSRTNVESIFAIGDVTDRIQLTPVALMEGMAMAKTMFGEGSQKPDYDNVPSAIFSQPPCGTCGLSEADAAKKYGSVDVYLTKFKPMKHTMPTGRGEEEKMMMKLICVSEGFEHAGKVVGCHMVGAEAGEMMQGIGIAMKAGATKADFDATIGIHPTAAEEWCTMRTKTRTTTAADVGK
jgi:glutathione reductase (NADPH)